MNERRHKFAGGQGHQLWPLLLLLLAAVVLPTACVLWFMTEAARNERMAVRQKLTDLYQAQAADLQGPVDAYWKDKSTTLSMFRDRPPAQRFAEFVTNGTAESVIVLDSSEKPAYPDATPRADMLAPQSTNEEVAVAAFRAEVQARVKNGDELGALRAVAEAIADTALANAKDDGGRLALPYVELFVLEHASNRSEAACRRINDDLAGRTADYRRPMPSAQRLFIMEQLAALDPNLSFATLRAEELAAAWLAAAPPTPRGDALTAAASNDLWQIASADGSAIGLFSRERVAHDMQALIDGKANLPGAKVTLDMLQAPAAQEPFLTAPAGTALPGWELRVFLEGPNPFAAAAERQVAAYLWTALLVVFVIGALAAMMARHLLRQTRLTKLKNDFVATVSHELKTPLASMRVLVDTLLEGRQKDALQASEYLALIAKENERLSRLIDNFLTFSRMERNKRAFEFTEVRPDQVVQAAVGTVRERFEAAGFRLELETAPALPTITADKDALVTVLLNLLDNAFKYSDKDKRIAVRANASDKEVCFEVEDHGIGLSRRDLRKVWDRFYQVDQSLSRRVGGCGLGLSIVKFIVEAHGGRVDVESQPGKGSTFRVRIPAP